MSYVHDLVSRAGEWIGERMRWLADAEIVVGNDVEVVEFFGGPLDGMQWQVDSASVFTLPPAIEIPLTARNGLPNKSGFSQRIQSSPVKPAVSRAADESERRRVFLYDLVPNGTSWEYRYGGRARGERRGSSSE